MAVSSWSVRHAKPSWMDTRSGPGCPEDWQRAGVCTGSEFPDDWFEPVGSERALLAETVCQTCPVRKRCLESALQRDESGVWGGVYLLPWPEQAVGLRKRGFSAPEVREALDVSEQDPAWIDYVRRRDATGKTVRTAPEDLLARGVKVAEMVAEGLSFRQAGEVLGVSHMAARRAYNAYKKQSPPDRAA